MGTGWSKNAFLHKNDVQTVTTAEIQHTEIDIRDLCDIRQSCSSNL